ncbi:lys-63-specific deubiquitinase BRCC36-like [Olea europaea subsp. europaea]|uniref:Lys-63-specific deubiquitinase BRCC36-like n=1 Tax=Olea europaea subsp. europaea TaxID=158383 RepID=A0A8S0TG30_OLEEU|nr:lys-63-specific deubiquitinase BRCC36-like [Olea europaea subsp. europaea]
MSLNNVKMSEEVWLTCLTHALSTETEEIMGLLLGDIQHSRNGNVTALIWGALPQPRSDRRKDRVETNPEQLTAASAQAERVTMATGITTRVIGWYHSHPHITVLPSHVDVRTQAMYQLLDSGFIGLIFSCFSEDAQKVGRIQVIAFQSSDGKQNNIFRPVSVSPQHKSFIDIESSLSSSENAVTGSVPIKESIGQDTGNSGATTVEIKVGDKSNDLGGSSGNVNPRMVENYNANNLNNAIPDLDPMEMSDGMQEAMHLSNLEMSGAEFVRKEISLHVLPTSSLLNLDSPLSSFTNLQHVLYEEEQTAYKQAVIQNMREGNVHPLTYIHHTSTFQASMCKMIEYCLSPAINVLQDQLRENEVRLKMLADEAKVLEAEIARGSESNSSPRSPSQGLRGSPTGHRDLYPTGFNQMRNVGGRGSRSRKGS